MILDSEFLYPVTKRVGMKVQDLRCPFKPSILPPVL